MTKQPAGEICPKCKHPQTNATDSQTRYRTKAAKGKTERVAASTTAMYRCPKCGHVFTRTVRH